MIKEWFTSISGNTIRRVTNPFLGTFVVVWIIYYWKPIYAIFTFDEDKELETRIEYLSNYFGAFSLPILIKLILTTFGVLISTYLLLFLSSFIANYYSKVLIPKVKELTDSNSVVPKEDYNTVLDMMENFSKKYNDERQRNISLQSRVEEMQLELTQSENFDEENPNNTEESENISKENEYLESNKLYANDPQLRLYKIIYNSLSSANRVGKFIKATGGNIKKKFYLDDYQLIEILFAYNLIEAEKTRMNPTGEYIAEARGVQLTNLGREFADYCMSRYAESFDRSSE